MKLLSTAGLALATIVWAGAASAASIAVFGDRFERDYLAAELTAQGHSVNNTAALPSDLSAFDTIWHVGAFTPLSSAVQSQLNAFLAAGKGIFLTGERPCCDALNTSIQSVVNANLKSGSVQIGSLGDIPGPYTYNPTALGNIGAGVSGWVPSAPGGISGVSGDNVLVRSTATGTTVAAAWNDDDFINGGRLAVFMDVNWLYGIDSAESDVIAATQEFLYDGYVGPNPDVSAVPLPAAGWLLLGGLGGIAALRRRRRS